MNFVYLLNPLPALTICSILALQILLTTVTYSRLREKDNPRLHVCPSLFPGATWSVVATNFSLVRPKPGSNILERSLICLLSATISGIILFSLWQHTEFFSYLIHVSKDGYLNRSLADIILSVAFTLPIILTLEIYFYQRQRKCRWQSLLFDKNVLTDTFMVSSFLFWYLPILLLTLANAIDANAVVSISRCLLMCSVPSLMAMALAGCISTSSRYKHIPGIDALSLKKYCHFLEDDNFSYAGLDDMTAAQLLDLTNIAVKIGDLEKADIISSYHLATVSPDLAFD